MAKRFRSKVKKSNPKTFNSSLHESGYFKYLQDQPILPMKKQLERLALYQQAPDADKVNLKEELYKSNWRLIYSLALRYANRIGFDTLYQEGCIGFFVALDKIDLNAGYSLTTIATAWIKQKIIRAINREGFLVGLPEHVYGEISKPLKKVREDKYVQKHKVIDLCIESVLGKDCSQTKMNKFFTYFQRNVPIADYVQSNGGDDCVDTKALLALDRFTQIKDVQQAVNNIKDPRARNIIIRYFGLDGKVPNTLEELGTVYDRTRERIRQIIRDVIEKELCYSLRAYDLKK